MKKLLSTALAVSILTTMNIAPALADALPAVGNTALPNLPDGVTNSNVVKDGAHMNITVGGGTQGAVDTIIWKDYNIGKDATVNYEFTDHHQTSINKVDATGGLSQIYGKITNSSCYNCGYENTGKIILVNPNGFIFGQNANVDVNSFTVSTLGLTSDQWTEEKRVDENGNEYTIEIHNIQFDRNGQSQGITIKDNAKIYGDKGVNLISDQIQYTGSKISTNLSPNYIDIDGNNTAFGKVKIVTADGVNFQYGVSGVVQNIPEAGVNNESGNKMLINLQGEIESGHIDIRNYSNNAESELNLNGATLKATKAKSGNDGNIWLISENTTTINSSEIYTGALAGAQERKGENLLIISKNGANIDNTTVAVGGDINASSTLDNITIKNNSNINAKNISIVGRKNAQIIGNSEVKALNDFSINGQNILIENAKITANNNLNVLADMEPLEPDYTIGSLANVNDINSATLQGKNITIDAQGTKINNSNIIATNDIKMTGNIINVYNSKAEANNNLDIDANESGSVLGSINFKDTTLKGQNIKLHAIGDIRTEENGYLDLTNSKTSITTEAYDINLKLKNVGNRNNGLVAEAGNNLTVATDGTLSVSRLVAKEGDLTITADKVIKGLPYTTEQKLDDDLTSDRGYIEVRNGKFTSNTKNDAYEVTASGELTADGKNNMRHHIQYGDGTEKILLVTKLPISGTSDPGSTPPVIIPPIDDGDDIPAIKINDDQAAMLNKLPQQPQHIANVNNISDGRTTFIDVFAAASQIEVDDEED